MAQDVVTRHLEVPGEASRNLERDPPDCAAAHPELPLSFDCEMRNAPSHGYFKIDLAIAWKTVECDRPPLRGEVRRISSTLQGL
jgi:uncharacterized protein with HEPN domain